MCLSGMYRSIWVCAFVFCLATRLDAVTQRTFADGYTRRVWQTQDGLPENTVQAFAQTPDHYLWIGTSGGLVRFDGARFVVFDRGNTPEIHENSVFCLTVSRDGSLWAGTDGGGLVRYHNGVFQAYSAAGGLTNGFVRAVYEDREGTLWAGTDDGLVSAFRWALHPHGRQWQDPRARRTCYPGRTIEAACGLAAPGL
jgi:hypothetical protein